MSCPGRRRVDGVSRERGSGSGYLRRGVPRTPPAPPEPAVARLRLRLASVSMQLGQLLIRANRSSTSRQRS